MCFRWIVLFAIAVNCSTALAQPGSSFPDIPRPTFTRPDFSRPPVPDLPEPTFPEFERFEPEMHRIPEPKMPDFTVPGREVQVCTNCNKEVGSFAMVGQTCPHCGVTWTYTSHEPMGASTPVSPQPSRSRTPAENFKVAGTNVAVRGLTVLLGVACAIISFGGLALAGIIFLVMMNRPKPASYLNTPPVDSHGYPGSRFGANQ